MRSLECNEIEQWCLNNAVGQSGLAVLKFPYSETFTIEVDGKPARAREGSETFVKALGRLGQFDQVLVIITQWGVWPSSEDWPSFYSWRASHGEKRSIEQAPGHVFTGSETEDLTTLLELIGACGWDAEVICLIGGRADKFGGTFSHDGYFRIVSDKVINVSW